MVGSNLGGYSGIEEAFLKLKFKNLAQFKKNDRIAKKSDGETVCNVTNFLKV